MKKYLHGCLFLIVLSLTACKSSKIMTVPVPTEPEAPSYLSSKIQLTVPNKGGSSIALPGTLKMKGGERIQLSVLMPVFRSEVARIDITPDEVLLVDRMNKRYVRATRADLKEILPKDADFAKLERILFKASLPGEKAELTGKELGIPSMEKARVKLTDFSTSEFELTPTEVSAKYTEVELNDLLKMLLKL